MPGKMGNITIAYGYARVVCAGRHGMACAIRTRTAAHLRAMPQDVPLTDRILASAPFAQQKLARYEVTEFKTTRLAPGLNLPLPA
ncbi:hypothetical protein BN2475_100055 [Paraburkholderia ribeironis]|uniref:Uncharacterized protein n=1 Tax=Paraburkholderia ribeironis TaxID=1247936 RepID=A0A1N7RPJ0_9BURK|nr:hypothetical protein BN2475_100055 [Paraburkholderia ribeironis]